MVKRILERGGCLKRARSDPTALQAAVVSGNETVVHLLLEHGVAAEVASPEDLKEVRIPDDLEVEMATLWSRATAADIGGLDYDPLAMAEQLGFPDILKLLMKHRV